MKRDDLEQLASWLRCYPVAGMESMRKRLLDAVENELKTFPAKQLTAQLSKEQFAESVLAERKPKFSKTETKADYDDSPDYP